MCRLPVVVWRSETMLKWSGQVDASPLPTGRARNTEDAPEAPGQALVLSAPPRSRASSPIRSAMARILIIEDESDLRQVLDYHLRLAGYEVLEAGAGQDGLRLAKEQRPDLVLLDLMLPDIPGTEVCRHLKDDDATRTVPIMMLTARGDEIDRVVGFELGADDYVTKPFSVRELMLRIRAVLRRTESPVYSEAVVSFGCLRVDRNAHRVWVSDEEVELTALEFRLLVVLYERRNRVQSRESLLDHVWSIDARISTRTVDANVKRLREKLGQARHYIETVRGVGYRFADQPDAS